MNEAEALHAEVGRPPTAALLARRLFPGVLPPRPFGVDGVVRRVLVVLVALLAGVGLVAYLAVATHNLALAAPVAAGVAGALAAMAIPWHRFAQDAFAAFSIAFALWVAWFIYATGGAMSSFMPLSYLAVVVAVPLSHRTGIVVGTAAALSAALPFVYQRVEQADAENILVRIAVLASAAVFATWLMAELRRAVRVAVTRQERLEDEQEASAQLRRSQGERQEYVSVLAHEMRNPLNAIGAAARMLAKGISGTPGEQTARAIATEAHHALELVDGLTDVASLESGRMRSALRPADLAAIVRETAAATVDRHRVVVSGAEQPMEVLGDDRRLGQVIRNLLSNAGKYSPADSEIQVSLGVSADRRSAIVQVRDAGLGIPPSERGRLFQKFARLSTAGGTRGSGLGLFISRGIVHDHGGELWADWPPGGGSVFSFRVPLMGDERRRSPRTVTP